MACCLSSCIDARAFTLFRGDASNDGLLSEGLENAWHVQPGLLSKRAPRGGCPPQKIIGGSQGAIVSRGARPTHRMSVSAAHQGEGWDGQPGRGSSQPAGRLHQQSVEVGQPVRETDGAAEALRRTEGVDAPWGNSTLMLAEWPEGEPRALPGRPAAVNGAVGGEAREGDSLQAPPRRRWHQLRPAHARRRAGDSDRAAWSASNGYDGHVAEEYDDEEEEEAYTDWGMAGDEREGEDGWGWGPAGSHGDDACAVLDELAARGQLDEATALFAEFLQGGEANAPGWVLGASLMRTLRAADRVDLMDAAFGAMIADDGTWLAGRRVGARGHGPTEGAGGDADADDALVAENEVPSLPTAAGPGGEASAVVCAPLPLNGARVDEQTSALGRRVVTGGGGHGTSEAARVAQDSAMARRAVYEAMILAHRKRHDWARLLALFDELQATSAPLTMPVCAAAIQACFVVVAHSQAASNEKGGKGEGGHTRANSSRVRVREPPSRLRARQAVSLFEHAARLGWLMRAPTYCQVLQCYMILRMPHRVVEVYRRMCVAGVKPKYAPAYKAILSACGQLGLWEELLSVVTAMRKDGFKQSARLYTCAISLLGKGGKWQEAARVFDLMRSARVAPDAVAYTSLITAYANGGQWEAAVAALAQMRARGVLPDVTAYTAALSACSKAGRADEALALLRAMARAGVFPNAFTASAAIHGLERAGRCDDAIRLYEEMLSMGVTPDLVTHTVYIKALGSAGRWQDAVAAFERVAAAAEASGRREDLPDRRCVGALLHALGVGRQVSRALALFARMRGDYGITPDTQLYNMLLAAVKRSGDIQDVLDVFDAMQRPGEAFAVVAARDKSDGVAPARGETGQCRSALDARWPVGAVSARGAPGQRVEARRRRKRHAAAANPHPPDTVTYNTLMSAFEQARLWNHVLATYEVMKGAGPSCAPDDSTHHVLQRVMDKLSSHPVAQPEGDRVD